MLAFPLTQDTGTVRLPSRHIYICMLCLQINKCQHTSARTHTHTHTYTMDRVHPNTNMPHRQNVLESLCEGDRPVCEAVSERALRFGTS